MEAHIRYLKYCLNVLPSKYESQEVNRLTLAYFVLNSLDVTGQLDHPAVQDHREAMINWIYSLQVVPDPSNPEKEAQNFGFRGSPFFGNAFNPQCEPSGVPPHQHDQGHLAMNYCALSLLAVLGDDYGRVNKVFFFFPFLFFSCLLPVTNITPPAQIEISSKGC